MAYAYPRKGTKAARYVTPEVERILAHPEQALPRNEARANARNFMATTRSGAKAVIMMTLMANDDLALCRYGCKGGFEVIWNFGQRGQGAGTEAA